MLLVRGVYLWVSIDDQVSIVSIVVVCRFIVNVRGFRGQ